MLQKLFDEVAAPDVSDILEKINFDPIMTEDQVKDKIFSIVKNADKPILLSKKRSNGGGEETFCYYYGGIYKVDHQYSLEEIELLIFELEDRERKKFEKLKKKMEITQQIEKQPERERIREEVRIAVWRRDEGKCVKCGSRDKLEYDHIIPVSKGGSNTVRNIELLCESCNRKKNARIE